MSLDDPQYERIARWLDGRDVALSEAERALAERIRRQEAQLAGVLDASLPPEALDRTRRRMLQALRRPPARRRWVGYAAAAAAVVLVAVLWQLTPVGHNGEEIPAEVVFGQLAEPIDLRVDSLAEEIDRLRTTVTAYVAPGLAEIDPAPETFQLGIESLWLTALEQEQPW